MATLQSSQQQSCTPFTAMFFSLRKLIAFVLFSLFIINLEVTFAGKICQFALLMTVAFKNRL